MAPGVQKHATASSGEHGGYGRVANAAFFAIRKNLFGDVPPERRHGTGEES